MNNTNNLSRSEKILTILYEISKHGELKIQYEDIVAGVFSKYPHDFHLKGYPEYPDSGDIIHKPLYDFKKKGYVNASNKIFSLTERGVELAESLLNKNYSTDNRSDRLSRTAETEVLRIKKLEGFSLFLEGEKDKLADNDFYNYLGVTVRTQKNAFLGRLETMNSVIKELQKQENLNIYKQLVDYHKFLCEKSSNIIEFFKK